MSMCLCGCKTPVARRFVPGHDGKLMSRLMKAGRAFERVEIYGQPWLPMAYAETVSDRFRSHLERLLFGHDWDREY